MFSPAKAAFVIEVDSDTMFAGETKTLNVTIRSVGVPDDLNFFVFDLVLTPITPLPASSDDVRFVDPGISTEPFAATPSYVFSGNSNAAISGNAITSTTQTSYANDTLTITDLSGDFNDIPVLTSPTLIAQFDLQTAMNAATGIYEVSVIDPFADDFNGTEPAMSSVSGFIEITVVPEPSSMLGLVVGILGGHLILRRRHQQDFRMRGMT
ncbi:PEP-CTERM sorting domain-containing protein [Rubripirellula amarantea]|uniref:Ice-binding protein C-terminal domain-containing protein n=1 Tax=Rubripirellula amarantea TaxID=2527999 RepID=A0A5C5WS99_9BACT|nr:PEP-CTERM sorting domain-containing protein [Rubripirellula amarantea]MDA8744594.1 PEP-CTERM sorting domain-containing protein [Rubripirellula amarantea]TWT53041.1 hypothetical protein Pla22_06690 [Rubripirellula amarantea]